MNIDQGYKCVSAVKIVKMEEINTTPESKERLEECEEQTSSVHGNDYNFTGVAPKMYYNPFMKRGNYSWKPQRGRRPQRFEYNVPGHNLQYPQRRMNAPYNWNRNAFANTYYERYGGGTPRPFQHHQQQQQFANRYGNSNNQNIYRPFYTPQPQRMQNPGYFGNQPMTPKSMSVRPQVPNHPSAHKSTFFPNNQVCEVDRICGARNDSVNRRHLKRPNGDVNEDEMYIKKKRKWQEEVTTTKTPTPPPPPPPLPTPKKSEHLPSAPLPAVGVAQSSKVERRRKALGLIEEAAIITKSVVQAEPQKKSAVEEASEPRVEKTPKPARERISRRRKTVGGVEGEADASASKRVVTPGGQCNEGVPGRVSRRRRTLADSDKLWYGGYGLLKRSKSTDDLRSPITTRSKSVEGELFGLLPERSRSRSRGKSVEKKAEEENVEGELKEEEVRKKLEMMRYEETRSNVEEQKRKNGEERRRSLESKKLEGNRKTEEEKQKAGDNLISLKQYLQKKKMEGCVRSRIRPGSAIRPASKEKSAVHASWECVSQQSNSKYSKLSMENPVLPADKLKLSGQSSTSDSLKVSENEQSKKDCKTPSIKKHLSLEDYKRKHNISGASSEVSSRKVVQPEPVQLQETVQTVNKEKSDAIKKESTQGHLRDKIHKSKSSHSSRKDDSATRLSKSEKGKHEKKHDRNSKSQKYSKEKKDSGRSSSTETVKNSMHVMKVRIPYPIEATPSKQTGTEGEITTTTEKKHRRRSSASTSTELPKEDKLSESHGDLQKKPSENTCSPDKEKKSKIPTIPNTPKQKSHMQCNQQPSPSPPVPTPGKSNPSPPTTPATVPLSLPTIENILDYFPSPSKSDNNQMTLGYESSTAACTVVIKKQFVKLNTAKEDTYDAPDLVGAPLFQIDPPEMAVVTTSVESETSLCKALVGQKPEFGDTQKGHQNTAVVIDLLNDDGWSVVINDVSMVRSVEQVGVCGGEEEEDIVIDDDPQPANEIASVWKMLDNNALAEGILHDVAQLAIGDQILQMVKNKLTNHLSPPLANATFRSYAAQLKPLHIVHYDNLKKFLDSIDEVKELDIKLVVNILTERLKAKYGCEMIQVRIFYLLLDFRQHLIKFEMSTFLKEFNLKIQNLDNEIQQRDLKYVSQLNKEQRMGQMNQRRMQCQQPIQQNTMTRPTGQIAANGNVIQQTNTIRALNAAQPTLCMNNNQQQQNTITYQSAQPLQICGNQVQQNYHNQSAVGVRYHQGNGSQLQDTNMPPPMLPNYVQPPQLLHQSQVQPFPQSNTTPQYVNRPLPASVQPSSSVPLQLQSAFSYYQAPPPNVTVYSPPTLQEAPRLPLQVQQHQRPLQVQQYQRPPLQVQQYQRHPPQVQQHQRPPPQVQQHQMLPPQVQQHQVPPPQVQHHQVPPPQVQHHQVPPPQVQQHQVPPPQIQQHQVPPPQVQQHQRPPPQVQQHQRPPQVQQHQGPPPHVQQHQRSSWNQQVPSKQVATQHTPQRPQQSQQPLQIAQAPQRANERQQHGPLDYLRAMVVMTPALAEERPIRLYDGLTNTFVNSLPVEPEAANVVLPVVIETATGNAAAAASVTVVTGMNMSDEVAEEKLAKEEVKIKDEVKEETVKVKIEVKEERVEEIEVDVEEAGPVEDEERVEEVIATRDVVSVDSGVFSPNSESHAVIHPDVTKKICICGKPTVSICTCYKAAYCSQECQVNDWDTHSLLCDLAKNA